MPKPQNTVTITLSAALLADLEAAAKADMMTKSAWGRRAIALALMAAAQEKTK